MSAATVLIPTHNHGPLLYHSVKSALAQTITDIEVFIIGDGVNETTRAVVMELKQDRRVRFFDHPKGPRLGEAYRHAALAEARGEIVCYLADDDLWLPNHIEVMRSALATADFVHAPYFLVDEQGLLRAPMTADLALPFYREQMLAGTNYIPLSCAAHTLEFYRRLPYGWRTTPTGTPTDLYMWQQILAQPHCHAISSPRLTVLNFPSPLRPDWSLEQRLNELAIWSDRIREPELLLTAFESAVRDHAAEEARLQTQFNQALAWAHSAETELKKVRAHLDEVAAWARTCEADLENQRAHLNEVAAWARGSEAELENVRAHLNEVAAWARGCEAELKNVRAQQAMEEARSQAALQAEEAKYKAALQSAEAQYQAALQRAETQYQAALQAVEAQHQVALAEAASLRQALAELAARNPQPAPDAGLTIRLKAATYYMKRAAVVLFPRLAELYRALRRR
jgi:GalNAc5-diNAcBac-PP-undecaprenol beta-1,3-glucosyltransferase